jgi:hypothetical protein
VSFLRKGVLAWRQDRLLQRVMRNSGYLFSSNTIGMVITAAQGFLAALLLGPANFGVLGMVVMYASSVNRLLAFRMGELVIKYAGQSLAKGQKDQAAAIIKYAGLAEAVTSVIAYLLLVLTAPLAANYIIKDPLAAVWINYYGLALLVNLITETSSAVLQVSGHFRTQFEPESALWDMGSGGFYSGRRRGAGSDSLPGRQSPFWFWGYADGCLLASTLAWQRLVEGILPRSTGTSKNYPFCHQHKPERYHQYGDP